MCRVTRERWEPRSRGGFILFEVILAMMIFSVAAVGLTKALNSMLVTTNEMQRDYAVQMGLEAIINEAKAREDDDEMELERREETLGVVFTTEVERVSDLENKEGRRLNDMHLLRATATFEDGSAEPIVIEMYLYIED